MKKVKKSKKTIAVILTVLSFFMFTQPSVEAHWAVDNLDYTLANKLLPQEFDRSNILSRLDDPISREDAIYLLTYAMNADITKDNFDNLPFADKSQISEYAQLYLSTAYRLGILTGSTSKGQLLALPKESITRQEAATVIGRALGINVCEDTDFLDDNLISSWAKPFIIGLKRAGIILGLDNNTFDPQGTFTWGQMLSIIQHAHNSGRLICHNIKILANNGNYIPLGITSDKYGSIYFTDTKNNLIKCINNNNISNFAGFINPQDEYGLSIGSYKDGATSKACFNHPSGIIYLDEGMLICDTQNNSIRIIKQDKVNTYAGGSAVGYKDGKREAALFNNPTGIAKDDKGNIYISDTGNNIIRKIDKSGNVTTVAGIPGKAGFKDGLATEALLNDPIGIAYYNGSLYIADSGNQRIRKLDGTTLSTVAGGGEEVYDDTTYYVGDYIDGEALNARFNNPVGLAFDKDGCLYITDMDNAMIRKYKSGQVSTILTANSLIKSTDKSSMEEYMVQPYGITIVSNQIIISDSFTHYIYSVDFIE